jgi:stringent starvation protein B
MITTGETLNDEPRTIRKKLEDALESGKVMVLVNTTVKGVKLPADLLTGATVPLIMSARYPGIDLVWNRRSVYATLRFGGVPFRCRIPYASVQHIQVKEILSPAQESSAARAVGAETPAVKSIGEQVKSGSQDLPRTGLGRKGHLTLLK